jgi:hypothetical protein
MRWLKSKGNYFLIWIIQIIAINGKYIHTNKLTYEVLYLPITLLILNCMLPGVHNNKQWCLLAINYAFSIELVFSRKQLNLQYKTKCTHTERKKVKYINLTTYRDKPLNEYLWRHSRWQVASAAMSLNLCFVTYHLYALGKLT